MRILICTNAYPPRFVGGAELVAHKLALEIAALGHEVAVFAGNFAEDVPRHALSSDSYEGLPVYRIALGPKDYDPANVNDVDATLDGIFTNILNDFRPDIVHCHNLAGLSVRIPLLAAEYGARTFVTLHDFWGFCLRNTLLVRSTNAFCVDRSACADCLVGPSNPALVVRFRQSVMALAFAQVDMFIAPSRDLANEYIASGFPADRMTVLPNGTDTGQARLPVPQAWPRSAQHDVVFLYAGYFGPHKGIDVLLRAIAVMQGKARVRLDLVGDGPIAPRLRQQVADLGLANQVRFRGKIAPHAMAQVFEGCDVLVLPSVWPENQPVSIMEAMAHGRPVVASRAGGIPEMLSHGSEGLLVPPGDATALANALDQLASSAATRQRMGAAAQARVAGHSYRDQASALEQVFNRGAPEATSGSTWSATAAPLVALVCDDPLSKFDLPFAQGTEQVIPYGWLTERQRSAVAEFGIGPGRDWRLILVRWLAPTRFNRATLPRWRRRLVEALLDRYLQKAKSA